MFRKKVYGKIITYHNVREYTENFCDDKYGNYYDCKHIIDYEYDIDKYDDSFYIYDDMIIDYELYEKKCTVTVPRFYHYRYLHSGDIIPLIYNYFTKRIKPIDFFLGNYKHK